MIKRLQSIISKSSAYVLLGGLLLLWFCLSFFGVVQEFMLPSPQSVVKALILDGGDLLSHSVVTLTEAAIGLSLSIVFAVVLAVVMDASPKLYTMCYPLMILSQTIPTIAIAPLLVLWLGFGMLPKVVLIFVTCFFPLAISVLGGLRSADPDTIRLFTSMGASKARILWWVKLPYATEGFFSGLKVSVSYAMVGAVISEWLGGNGGLGVYMIRVRKAYAFDKMFAVIFLISIISLLAIWLVDLAYKKSTKWKREDGGK